MLVQFAFLIPLSLTLCSAFIDTDPPEKGPKSDLFAADRAFAKAVAEKGLDGWLGFMADDVARAPKIGAKLVSGKDEVRKADAAIFADPKSKLVWEPVDAHVFADGKSGCTSGRYEVRETQKDGSDKVVSSGGYVTIWRQQADGQWRVIFDTGAPDPAPPEKKNGQP